MESFAHRKSDGAPVAGPLSATERADARWGLERVLRSHAGAGTHDLARALQRALRHLPVVMLHDRLLPDGTLVEHLAIGPGGVTVIAGWSTADAPAPLTVEHLHGIFSAHADLLRDGAHADRTALVSPVRARVATVRDHLDNWVPVLGALCLDGAAPTLLVEDVTVADAFTIAALAAREGDLHDYELATLVDHLDASLPVALRG